VPARLVCPLDGVVVVDGAEPVPGVCPGCGSRYAGGGASPPEAVARALSHWGLDERDPGGVARRLFELEPGPPPEPAMAITSDRRDGFYLWWLFARGAPADALAALMGDPPPG
jgi:hypothetical protein